VVEGLGFWVLGFGVHVHCLLFHHIHWPSECNSFCFVNEAQMYKESQPMSGKNWRLVTNEPVEFEK
jgi:hypothetical protein